MIRNLGRRVNIPIPRAQGAVFSAIESSIGVELVQNKGEPFPIGFEADFHVQLVVVRLGRGRRRAPAGGVPEEFTVKVQAVVRAVRVAVLDVVHGVVLDLIGAGTLYEVPVKFHALRGAEREPVLGVDEGT